MSTVARSATSAPQETTTPPETANGPQPGSDRHAAADPTQPPGLTLTPAEQTLLGAEIGPFADALGDPVLRQRYRLLETAVAGGQVASELVGLVEALAELLLQTQRVRRRHGPEAERSLAALYRRTPRGVALHRSVEEVNIALAALRGQVVEEIAFAPTPGGQCLRLTTLQGHLELLIDRAGVRVERVELGSPA